MSVTTDGRVGGTYSSALGAANAIGGVMNIPELIMAIQIERGNILDGQIRDQMADMQKRNEWLRDANAALNALRAARPDSADGKVDYSTIKFTDSKGNETNALEWARANGIAMPGTVGVDDPLRKHLAEATAAKQALDDRIPGTNNSQTSEYPPFRDSSGKEVSTMEWAKNQGYPSWDDDPSDNVGFRREMEGLQGNVANDITATKGKIAEIESKGSQSDIDQAIANMKSSVDTVNSQSQMDMVRLQGLMDKRNQAMDMITNTLSKSGKGMDSIIGNMR
jgi:hypothetical protein